MGIVVTVMNMKGGVGKTTVAMHLAGMMARRRWPPDNTPRKVLAIDYDPQFNLSQAFLPSKRYFALEADRKTTISILTDDDTDLDPYHLQVPGNHTPPKVATLATNIYTMHSGGRLDIVPSTLDLMYVALGQANVSTNPIEERFTKFIDECKSQYDITLIDCHPAGSLFTKTSLQNSDHVLIPVAPDRYAVRGIGLMMNFMKAKKTGTPGPEPHILFNQSRRAGASSEETEIRSRPEYGKFCLKNTLRWYRAFSDPEGGQNFVWVSGKPYSRQANQNLFAVTQELLTRIGA
jgi:chromosome partitioning protein